MTKVIKTGVVRTPTPSPGYIAYYPCFQGNTDVQLVDRSGRGINAAFGSDLTTGEAWASANKFSGVDSTNQDYAILSNAYFSYDFNAGDSLVIAARVQMAAPGASRTLFGRGWGASAEGWRLTVKNTGVVSPILYHSGGTKFLSDTAVALADNVNHSFMFAWYGHDTVAGTAFYMVWIDGARAYNSAVATSSLGTVTSTEDFRISGNKTGASAYQSTAAKFDGIHILRSAASKAWTLAQLDEIAMRLHRFPHVPLTSSVFPSA